MIDIKRYRLVLACWLSMLGLLAGFLWPAEMKAKGITVEEPSRVPVPLLLPFSSGETWYVCQGYNGSVSHQNVIALDLSFDPMSAGSQGCTGSSTASGGKAVTAPGAGNVYRGTPADVVYINFDAGGSVVLGHFQSKWGQNQLPNTLLGHVDPGELLGTVSPPNGTNGGYAHIHIELHAAANGSSSAIPFDSSHQARFACAPDMPASGAINQYSGTALTGCDAPPPALSAPANELLLQNPTVAFSWQPMGGTTFLVEVWQSSGWRRSSGWQSAPNWTTMLPGDGLYSWHVQAGAGAATSAWSETWSFSIDSTNPGGHIAAPLDGSATSTPNWTLRALPVDAFSGVKEVAFYARYDGIWHAVCTSSAPPYACPWSLPAGVADQQVTFTMHVRDKAGNLAVDPGGYRVVAVDRIVPTGSVTLNYGWDTTDRLAIPLSLAADGTGSPVTEVCISSSSLCTDWRPMASPLWAVLGGQHGGSATAYVRYRDAAGNTSASIQATIPLDFYPDRPHSASYRIRKDVQAAAGGAHQSAGYRLTSTLGQPVASRAVSSPHYQGTWGYWPALQPGGDQMKVFLPVVIR